MWRHNNKNQKTKRIYKIDCCFGCVLFIHVACLWMCVLFSFSFFCLHVCAYAFKSGPSGYAPRGFQVRPEWIAFLQSELVYSDLCTFHAHTTHTYTPIHTHTHTYTPHSNEFFIQLFFHQICFKIGPKHLNYSHESTPQS